MGRDVVAFATDLVRARFPMARAAWLGGSAASNAMTSSSDLDVVVLLAGEPAPFRESLVVQGQPVEMFVHTEESLAVFCAADLRRHRPTMLRLVGSSIVLLDRDGVGRRLQEDLRWRDAHGPPVLAAEEIDALRYAVTDLLDDFCSGGPEILSVAAELWRQTAELVLGANARWTGTGKWLLREVRAFDAANGTDVGERLVAGLAAASQGDIAPMREAVDAVLGPLGGRLFEGFRRQGIPATEMPAGTQPPADPAESPPRHATS